MSRINAFARFLYDFVVGDDWRIAVGVVLALGLTALIGGSGWWLLPLVVTALLGLSVWSAARKSP